MAVMKRKGGGSRTGTRLGRPPKDDKTLPWTIRIPESVAGPWDMILHDPQLGRSKIGLRQFIISELMRLLLEAWQEGRGEIQVAHILARVNKELTSLQPGELE